MLLGVKWYLIADYCSKPTVIKHDYTSHSAGKLVNTQIADLYLLVSYSAELGWGLKIGIYNKVPGDADATGPGTTGTSGNH